MKSILVCFCLLGVAKAGPVPFKDCGSEYDLQQIDVQNCKKLPCPIFMERSTHFNVSLTASFQSQFLTQIIKIQTKGINNDVISRPAPCMGARSCPVKKGNASFQTELLVHDIAPFPSSLDWILLNENNRKVMCFNLDIILCEKNDIQPECYQ